MNKHFYLKMAVQNIRKNRRIYVPFILAAIGMTALYCIFSFMAYNTGLELVRGSDVVKTVLAMGCRIMEIFSVIFFFYTNSFLMKQRKKELGLYCVLGMERRHVDRILSRETLVCGVISIGGGLLLGSLFSKACYVILLRLLGNGVTLGFMAPGKAIGRTVLVFAGVFLLIYLYNSSCVKMIRPLELLQSGKKGEREPKAKWLQAILSTAMLGFGYYLAISSGSPVEASNEFFIAVIWVIAGTYGLFQSVIVAVLKLLQKKKSYYYKTRNFVAVSGLQYRMKRNAVSLANICILSTAVLVMVSTTVTIYAQIEGRETVIQVSGDWQGEKETNGLEKRLEKMIGKYGKKKTDVFAMRESIIICYLKNGNFVRMESEKVNFTDIVILEMIDAPNFEKSFGEKLSLKPGEVIIYKILGEELPKTIQIGEKTYKVKEARYGCPYPDIKKPVSKAYFIVTADEKELCSIYQTLSGEETSALENYHYYWYLSPGLDREGELELAKKIRSAADEYGLLTESGEEAKEDFIAFNGSLLFIGVFLAIVFMAATVLIIYYKQLTEGYEDCERFQIMCKVGMSQEEVKASIRSQVLLVFFLPVLMAGIHLLAASPCLMKILNLFQVMDEKLFAVSAIVTLGVFALIYICVYGITARSYYHIVNGK
ncbi:MAG: FtsX-like permease family protein [Acetivibrio ethanolgignens]